MIARLKSIDPAQVLFVAGLSGLVAYALRLGRDISFFSDDWPLIAFHHSGNYLTPYSGHLLLVPILILHTLWVTFGLGSYTPYLVTGLAFYAAVAVIVFMYFRRHVTPLLAALAALLLVWYSTGQFNVLFPVTLNFSIPLIAAVAIWMLLDRNETRADLAAALCLGVTLASGGVGVVVTAVVGLELLLTRAPIRRWLVFAPPVALWAVWYVLDSEGVAHPNTLTGTIRFAAHELQLTFAGFAGGWEAGGYLVAAAALALFAVAILRWHTFTARAAAALSGAIVFAVLTGYTPRHGNLPAVPADTPRYLWLNAFFIIAAVIEVLRGRTIPRWVPAVATALVVISAITLVGNLRDYHQRVVDYKHSTQTFLYAVEAIPDHIDKNRILPLSFELVRAGQYLDAVRHLGSPLENVSVRDLGSEADRQAADGWMIQDLHLALAQGVGETSSTCMKLPEGLGTQSSAGVTDLTGAVNGPSRLVVHAGRGGVTVSLRRLARQFDGNIGQIPPNGVATLDLPKDHSPLPWHVRVNGAVNVVSVCH